MAVVLIVVLGLAVMLAIQGGAARGNPGAPSRPAASAGASQVVN
jgi:hypothetical protein